MGDKGYFSGISWHTEFHTVNRKKEKAADCIYLDEERICSNKYSPCYLTKCFEASSCKLRIKEGQKKPSEKKSRNSEKINICSLPIGSKMYHKKYGVGIFVDFNKLTGIITLQFPEKKIKFKYPDAIQKKFLYIDDDLYQCVLNDIK